MKKFSTFEDVKHIPLRVYNRSVMAFNIYNDYGTVPFQQYCENFNDNEKKQIIDMMQYILVKGREAAKQVALKDFVPEEDLEEMYG